MQTITPWNASTIMDASIDGGTLQRSPSIGNVNAARKADWQNANSSGNEGDRELRKLFGLNDDELLCSSHPCWLFRSIQLHGTLYLFTTHICFYAKLPPKHDKPIFSGQLFQSSSQGARLTQHHAVLRSTSLCWYESERDPFFPQDKIDLRDILSVEFYEGADARVDAGEFRYLIIITRHRELIFGAATARSRDEWLNALRRALLSAQNDGESVNIAIPIESVLGIDHSEVGPLSGHMSAAEQEGGKCDVAIVAIKVINSEPGDMEMTMDEYFFTNMADELNFVQSVQARLDTNAQVSKSIAGNVRATLGKASLGRQALKAANAANRATAPRLSSYSGLTEGLESELADAALSDVPWPSLRTSPAADTASLSSSVRTLRADETNVYPPNTSTEASVLRHAASSSSVPAWLRQASNRIAANAIRSVREIWTADPTAVIDSREDHERSQSDSALSGHLTGESLANSMHSSYSILETEQAADYEEDVLGEAVEHFRYTFSLPDSERLITHTRVCLYRFLPVMGRLYISSGYICFRSSSFFSNTMGKTLMILPRQEIVSVCKNNAVQYGRHGLVIIVRGHEEVFLEFLSAEQRDQCISIIDYQEHSGRDNAKGDGFRADLAPIFTDAVPVESSMSTSGHLNASASSLLSLPVTKDYHKPREGLRFTILTIGSRGDVQPYIALAKGLQRDGHHVRIATHEEFQGWIESYGIDFFAIGGDPAELMRICVENGTFTLAFVRESVTHFRGWLDDLLNSSWNACQGTDVIIESPSAMAGIHIAEALKVPYYRAFTMPWTRTRAYPHAFAVPSGRAGGNYNYMSYVIFDQILWRASAGQINSWRSKCMGLRPTTLDLLRPHEVPFLYNFSPHLVPKPLDWADWIHITGFWFLDNADARAGSETWSPPAELVSFIGETRQLQRKLVYIGWGSIVIKDADDILKTVVEAVRKSGVRAVISRGWSDRLKSGVSTDAGVIEGHASTRENESVWKDIFTIDSVPHDWLFPQVDVACHHGGSGTLGASLRAGLPTIIKPFFGDQFFWAKQVESLQIGQSIIGPFDCDRFAEAMRSCTSDARMRKNARILAEKIAKEDGVRMAIRAIYSNWERANSRLGTSSSSDAIAASTLTLPEGLQSPDDQMEHTASGDEDDDDWSVVSGGAQEDQSDGSRRDGEEEV
jgi:UDP:flavonoid glycosyltransferase YjiC (YdhE family)